MAKTTKTSTTATKKTAAAKTTATKAAIEEKKTAAVKAAPAKAETKVEVKAEVKATPVAEEKKPVAKRTCSKTTAAKTSAPAEVKADVFVEYSAAQVSVEKVIEDVKKTYAAEGNTEEIKSVKVYLKPEENAAYYVINETINGRMDVYFC